MKVPIKRSTKYKSCIKLCAELTPVTRPVGVLVYEIQDGSSSVGRLHPRGKPLSRLPPLSPNHRPCFRDIHDRRRDLDFKRINFSFFLVFLQIHKFDDIRPYDLLSDLFFFLFWTFSVREMFKINFFFFRFLFNSVLQVKVIKGEPRLFLTLFS